MDCQLGVWMRTQIEKETTIDRAAGQKFCDMRLGGLGAANHGDSAHSAKYTDRLSRAVEGRVSVLH
jgi:hypothetical protein